MKAIKQALVEKYFGRHLDLRVRLFNTLAMGGILISLAMASVTPFTGAGFNHFLVNILLAAVSFGLLYFSRKTGNYQLCYLITVVCIFMILFPVAFFVSDGYRGGMPTFFVFAVAISVFMLRGRTAFVVTAIELAIYVGLCVFAYYHPESIQHFASEGDRLRDLVLSFVVVSIALGIIMHYHFRMNYEQQSELEKAREEALALSRVKTTFLTNISHEIRTPINVVLGMNEMILRESTSDQIRRYAANIQIAGKTLLSLINNVLDIAKIESGKLELIEENYKTADLIFDLVVIGRESAAKKGLVFQTQVDRNLPSVFHGDSFHIKRVVVNFLSNAVKYTNEGFVTLGFSWKGKGDQALLCISVQDTGIGIESSDVDRLFESFTRAERPSHRVIEGSGLGLAIAKELTDLMGGTISVESKVGYGSTFTVELPQTVVDPTPLGQWESQQAAVTLEGTSFTAPAARILIVDDNKENLEVTKTLLKESLVQVDTALSGRQCLALAERHHYDLILMDYMMPELDGLETLRLLRKKGVDTPAVAVTANILPGTKETLLGAGFAAFLTKPLIWNQLQQTVMELLPQELVQPKAKRTPVDVNLEAELSQKLAPFGVSVEEGLIYVSSDLAQYKALSDIFREHSGESRQEIAELLKTEDLENLIFSIHSLKSKALAIGAVELSRQAATMEKHLRRGDSAYARAAMSLLMFTWDRVLAGLKEVETCLEC
jgi:signal transduction histidine kinase/DNA-binding NarL/FixJ family response regulator